MKMKKMRKIVKQGIYIIVFLLLFNVSLNLEKNSNADFQVAFAEKSDFSTSFEEFLPLGAKEGSGPIKENYDTFMKDPTLIRDAELKGIKFLKEQKKIVFCFKAENPDVFKDRTLKYEIITVNFPPRVVLRMYGVKSQERLFKFFSNIDIVGIVLNPFLPDYISEYVIFFKDWMSVKSSYDNNEKCLSIEYSFEEPSFKKGYGIRIADTNIDPLSQVVEVKNELRKSGLKAYLLVANDYKTIVLESPFYKDKDKAVSYMESLENIGYNGKLAIRSYKDFPKAHRFEVVSEPIITGQDNLDLRKLVYDELSPEKVSSLSYKEIYSLTKDIFSPKIQNDKELMAKQYFILGNMYTNYETDKDDIRKKAFLVAVKIFEIVYFKYPKSTIADDALWDMAMIIHETGVSDLISEEDCYKKIVKDYPESDYYSDALKNINGNPNNEERGINRSLPTKRKANNL